MHGARAWLAVFAVALLALAWADQDARVGQLATDGLILLSCVTLGRLLAESGPLNLVKIALVVMAAIDAYLVFSGQLEGPNQLLVTAVPAPGLPQLQAGVFSGSSLGYGDFLAAGVLGGILAIERGPQWLAAIAVLAVSLAWDQLFLVTDILPATVPPALVLLALEANKWLRAPRPDRRRRRGAQTQTGKVAETR
jgi:hypothetical protein